MNPYSNKHHSFVFPLDIPSIYICRNSTNMNIGIIDIGLTALLSDCIKVSTDDNNPIQIVVRFNNIKIYESTLFPLNGIVKFYELNFLVQEYMRNNLFSAGQLSVSAVFPHIIPFTERAIEPYAETVTAFVVYSSIRTSYERQ